MPKIKDYKVEIRMYRMGTGDCFVLKFLDRNNNSRLKIMIDAGVCNISKTDLTPYMKDLLKYVDNEVDVLIVTHEHTDHVLAFQRCEQLFREKFNAKEIWFGWPEDDNDTKVKRWKRDYGQKKLALYQSCEKVEEAFDEFKKSASHELHPMHESIVKIFGAQKDTIQSFIELAIGEEETFNAKKKKKRKKYIGDLAGMAIAKDKFGKDDTIIKYKSPGDLIDDFERIAGIKIYVLGPPELYKEVEMENGGDGESYDHSQNKHDFNYAFMNALDGNMDKVIPFSDDYLIRGRSQSIVDYKKKYEDKKESWRKIEHDWIYSSATFALRMNSLTNNLSLAVAIELQETKEVLLFPGDAEYGSWASWHDLEWKDDKGNLIKAQDLLNRTILYKVAHHMSHNGTARKKGLEMMTSKNLAAFVPLSYERIGHNWSNTMPNKYILEELLNKTKGKSSFAVQRV